MAVWNVSTAEKKSVEEHEIWTKDGVEIRRLNGFRWGSWTVTTSDDDEPQFERAAVPGGSDDEDSIDMYNCYDNNIEEVELDSLDDGWYGDWIFPDDFDEEERDRIIEGWEEDSYEFMENEGWYQSDGECWAWGELTIERADDGDEENPIDDDWDAETDGVQALEDSLSELGASLGMPMTPEEEEEAYTSHCPHCGWKGPMVDTVFKDGEFYCPECGEQFISRATDSEGGEE